MSTKPLHDDPQQALASIMAIARAALKDGETVPRSLSSIFELAQTPRPVAEPARRPAPLRAKALYAARRRRERIFSGNADLFSDPSWDIMLDLFVAQHEQRTVSVSSACLAACVAQTTALRWLTTLERRGLIVRTPDPGDGRRSYLCLTDTGFGLMEQALVEF